MSYKAAFRGVEFMSKGVIQDLSSIAIDNRSAIQSRFGLVSWFSSVKCRDRSTKHLVEASLSRLNQLSD
ncbi:hypothetical protein X801_07555 [Opisthorchis viverrini]|uniref:Uncharacterized protein n=1 Tax=Opisthorchis viverrini TaxID=6198 RepID=A0A1S8WQF0_OPIVI|nr:hypothetical protein X801_07555 [Opisthorchis viverrini]